MHIVKVYYPWDELFAFFQFSFAFKKDNGFNCLCHLRDARVWKETVSSKDWNGSVETGPAPRSHPHLFPRVLHGRPSILAGVSEKGDIPIQGLWPHFGDSNGFIIWESLHISAEPGRLFFFFLTKLLSLLTCWPKYVIMLLFQLLESKERAKAVVSVFQQTSSLNWREEFIGNTPQKCPEAENEAWKRQDGVKRPDPEVSLGDCNSNLTIRPEWTENCIGTTQKQPFWMMCLLSKAPIPRTEHLHDATSIRAYTSLGCRKSWSPVLPDSIQGKTGVSLGRGNGCWEAKILPSVHDIWYYWHICIQKYLRMVAGFAV